MIFFKFQCVLRSKISSLFLISPLNIFYFSSIKHFWNLHTKSAEEENIYQYYPPTIGNLLINSQKRSENLRDLTIFKARTNAYGIKFFRQCFVHVYLTFKVFNSYNFYLLQDYNACLRALLVPCHLKTSNTTLLGTPGQLWRDQNSF